MRRTSVFKTTVENHEPIFDQALLPPPSTLPKIQLCMKTTTWPTQLLNRPRQPITIILVHRLSCHALNRAGSNWSTPQGHQARQPLPLNWPTSILLLSVEDEVTISPATPPHLWCSESANYISWGTTQCVTVSNAVLFNPFIHVGTKYVYLGNCRQPYLPRLRSPRR